MPPSASAHPPNCAEPRRAWPGSGLSTKPNGIFACVENLTAVSVGCLQAIMSAVKSTKARSPNRHMTCQVDSAMPMDRSESAEFPITVSGGECMRPEMSILLSQSFSVLLHDRQLPQATCGLASRLQGVGQCLSRTDQIRMASSKISAGVL